MSRPAAIGEAAAVFHALVTAHGLQLEELTARSAWQVFGDYGRVAFETPDLPDADGLLYQYGMHRLRQRSLFELDLVRQFEVVDAEGNHDHYVQMHCTLRYAPTPELAALGADQCWWFPDQGALAAWLHSVAARPEVGGLGCAEAKAGRGSPGGRLRTSLSCRAAFGSLPTRQVVDVDRPHPPVQLVTIAATLERGCSSSACPPRARSTGNWRSLTVNNGRPHAALACAIGVASGWDDGTGRAFQARDRWGHIGATPDRTAADNTGKQRSGIFTGQCRYRGSCPGRHNRPTLSRTEEVA
ncbi:MAG TPA: hypothetical protein VKB85_13035 [Propionibacteriaceae bacterium]|nr:hypothetical protein [Propionibacteriaceae bacterium]